MAWSAFLSFYPTMMFDTYEISLRWTGAILAVGVFVGGATGLHSPGKGWPRPAMRLAEEIGQVPVIVLVCATSKGAGPTGALTVATGSAYGPMTYAHLLGRLVTVCICPSSLAAAHGTRSRVP